MSKRPNSTTNNSSPSKRNRTHQSEWGLPQVLAECGCSLRPASRGEEEEDDTTHLGCQLEPRITPTALCSSLNALLNEMASGVDPNNKRVLDSLEETLGGSLDSEGGDNKDNNGDNESNGGKTSSLLRRMLLPLYRIRSETMQSQLSQMSQSPSRGISGIKTESYSLVQVLLRIDILQPRLLSSLIQLLPEIASRFESEDSLLLEDVPKLIFSNIRWLDRIIDSASLTTAFSECLTVLASSSADCPKTKGILLDAIATLPDVLNDYNTFGGDDGHAILATLQLLRVEDPTLLIPCLDAIDSLPLSEREVEIVMNDALEALSNVEAWGLPALTTFLINNCPRGGNGMARQVIEEFRKLPLGGRDDDEYRGDEAQSANDTEALMIEALSRGFAHRSDLTSTLLKSIKETAQGYHKSADIWLLACCASATHNRAQVKTVFRQKANDGGFTSQMVRQSLEGNGIALTSLFGTSLCDLADSLLRSTDSEASELGVTLYEVLFAEFKEPMQRQEVVGSLATHVGAGVGSRQSEVDAAMRVFSSIISQKKSRDRESGVCALRPFTPFLTSLLDHLPNMTPFQVRKLFMLLFTVGAEGEEGTGGGLCGEAGILIKKYIGLHDFAKKQIGIIGTISYAVSTSSYFLEHQQANNDVDGATLAAACLPCTSTESSSVVKEIKEMIEFALSNCKPPNSGGRIQTGGTSSLGSSFADSCPGAFLLHELGHAVRSGKLLPSIRDWLDEHFQAEFEHTYIADFVVENTQEERRPGKGSFDEGSKGSGTKLSLIPTSPNDLAILNRTSSNNLAPPGEVRFALNGPMAEIYIKILPLLSSPSVIEREVLPVQLCPMLSLMATLSDMRYGGQGLGELDAVLECPMILPSSECSGIEFADLPPSQQWVTAASYYFATCWVRELINAFIHAETFTPTLDSSKNASRSASSQGFQVDIKVRLVDRLKNLLELEEELRFTSSKCYTFAPPGLDVLAPPKELFESDIDDEHHSDVFRDIDPNDMSESVAKKASKNAKKLAAKRAKQNEKSKAKRLTVKSKYEKMLADRALGQLRPLDPAVCIALGFKQLSPMCDVEEGSQLSALGLSQMQAPKVAGPTHLMLFNVLDRTLSQLLSNKQGVPFKAGNGGTSKNEDAMNDNPYGANKSIAPDNNFSDVLLATCDASQKECFSMLRLLLEGNVFSSLFEHLATLAQYRCDTDIPDEDSEKHVLMAASSLFSCITTILGSNKMTRSSAGRSFLAGIVKAISVGCVDKAPAQASADEVVKWLSSLFDLVKEIVTGAYTDDIEFVMNGMNCMSTILDCSRRLVNNKPDSGDNGSSKEVDAIRDKLADVTNSLLRRGWSEETKLNRNNVGKMVSLLLESSHTEIPSSTNAATKVDVGNLGRISTLRLLVNDVLSELPNTEKCKGPVDLFQTCSSQTFSCYYSVVLSFLQKELASLFDSCLGKTKDPSAAKKTLEVVTELVSMIQTLFDLTRKNEALAKKHPLLQQLKWGSRFIETFVSKAIPFFHTHFQEHQDSILMIITDLQKASRQLYHIISHGKRVKDANLAKETPRSKKALELFIHKVKALLKKNRCLTAMWTKTLKSKDIDGTVLKDDKGSVHVEEESDSDHKEEEEDDNSSIGSSAGEYETDDSSVDE